MILPPPSLSDAAALPFPALPDRWGMPTDKDLDLDRRQERAQALRLVRLAAPWRTRTQLERLAAAPRGAGETFRFAVLGDAEPGRFWIFRKLFNRPGMFETQLGAIQESGADFTLQLGDMVSRGTPENYRRFFRSLDGLELRTPYLTAIGNHDRRFPHGKSDSELYRACFGGANYSFDRGAARFVVLDSSASAVSARQLKWLDRALDTKLRKVVFTHIPPACLRWSGVAGGRGLGGFRPGASEFVSLMSRRGVDRVYFGHIHAFSVQDLGGVRYVLTGGGGSPLFPCGIGDVFHHYLVVSVGPDGVRETVHGADGRRRELPPKRNS